MEFFRQEYWSGLSFPYPGDLPDPGLEPRSPALLDSLLTEPPGLNSSSEFTVFQIHRERTADARMWIHTLIVCLKLTLVLENPQPFTSASYLPTFPCVSPTVMEEVGRERKINPERSERESEDWKEVRMEEESFWDWKRVGKKMLLVLLLLNC